MTGRTQYAITDMTGRRFGRLVVLRRAPSHNYYARWLCRCDCGKEVVVVGCNVRRAKNPSCGCGRAISGIEKAARMREARLNQYVSLWSTLERKPVRILRRLLAFDSVSSQDLFDALEIDADSGSRTTWYAALAALCRYGRVNRTPDGYRITAAGREWLEKQLRRADPGVATDEEAEMPHDAAEGA